MKRKKCEHSHNYSVLRPHELLNLVSENNHNRPKYAVKHYHKDTKYENSFGLIAHNLVLLCYSLTIVRLIYVRVVYLLQTILN